MWGVFDVVGFVWFLLLNFIAYFFFFFLKYVLVICLTNPIIAYMSTDVKNTIISGVTSFMGGLLSCFLVVAVVAVLCKCRKINGRTHPPTQAPPPPLPPHVYEDVKTKRTEVRLQRNFAYGY